MMPRFFPANAKHALRGDSVFPTTGSGRVCYARTHGRLGVEKMTQGRPSHTRLDTSADSPPRKASGISSRHTRSMRSRAPTRGLSSSRALVRLCLSCMTAAWSLRLDSFNHQVCASG